jgi:hypothetical protein
MPNGSFHKTQVFLLRIHSITSAYNIKQICGKSKKLNEFLFLVFEIIPNGKFKIDIYPIVGKGDSLLCQEYGK